MLAGSVVIFVIVAAVLFMALRGRSSASLKPRQMIVWGGIAFPATVLCALVLYAFVIGERLLARPAGAADITIEAVSRMWQWEFHYPEAAGRATLDVLHIPAGATVEFLVTSEDVIHSFWVPRLGGKIDAIPGHTNRIRLRADRPGTYGGICAEYCGIGHPGMLFTVVAHEADAYAAALAEATR